MRTREYPMAPQKSSVGNQFRQPRKHSERGDQDDALINGRMAPACHRSSQKSTAQARMVRRPFMEVSG